MDDAFRPEEILATLAAQNVRFVLIGGMAAILHGDAGVTVDLDIVPAVDAENLDRLAAALRGLKARIRTEGEPNGLPFDCSGAFLSNLGPHALLNLTTSAGDMDIVLMPAGTRQSALTPSMMREAGIDSGAAITLEEPLRRLWLPPFEHIGRMPSPRGTQAMLRESPPLGLPSVELRRCKASSGDVASMQV